MILRSFYKFKAQTIRFQSNTFRQNPSNWSSKIKKNALIN